MKHGRSDRDDTGAKNMGKNQRPSRQDDREPWLSGRTGRGDRQASWESQGDGADDLLSAAGTAAKGRTGRR